METKKLILVVDDDDSHRAMLEAVLGEKGYDVVLAGGGKEALEILGERTPALVLLDIRMEGMGGLETLEAIVRIDPGLPVIMMTAYASVDTAVETLKKGAHDYLTKPLDREELLITITRVLEHSRLVRENRELRARVREDFSLGSLVAASPGMVALVETLRRVAPTEATVLILGESGTGKEVVANVIHENSPRSTGPFVAVNCAAIPDTLLESELFGHEKGAFTGAVTGSAGRIAAADGGTLLLDEIAEMPATLQAKILRFLQEKEIQPLGSGGTKAVDVRIVAATNRNLEEEVREGRFREDLFYRLNVINVPIPPLRERREDIPLLSRHFLEAQAGRHGRKTRGFSREAASLLQEQPWPGNVRELENSIERAVVLSTGELLAAEDLFPRAVSLPEQAGGSSLGGESTLREAEVEIIKRTLERCDGNKTQTAKVLGISRQTLINKLKES